MASHRGATLSMKQRLNLILCACSAMALFALGMSMLWNSDRALFVETDFPPLSNRTHKILSDAGDMNVVGSLIPVLPVFERIFSRTRNVTVSFESHLTRDESPWEQSTVLPKWMKDYFMWHKKHRQLLDQAPQKWESYQFLILRCLATDKCGGASDRLHQIPMVIRLAAETNRLLFIKWEDRPFPLEQFFVPPPGGMDWRVPAWLDDKLKFEKDAYINNNNFYLGILANYSMIQGTIVDVMCNFGQRHGRPYYDNKREKGEPNFETVYRDVWRSVFQPVPPIQALIEKEFAKLGLVAGNYTSVHVRSQYLSDSRFDKMTNENAINCGLMLQPDLPVYVASDSAEVTKYLVNYGRQIRKRVMAREVNGTPLHLDRGANFLRDRMHVSEPVDQFYDTFVDLYLLAGAKCVIYGKGGYGKWASLLSYDPNCKKVYTDSICTILRKESNTDRSQTTISASRDSNSMKVVRLPAPEVESSPNKQTGVSLKIPHKSPWDDSTVLPIWMKEYFVWHRQQRQLLDQSKNWESFKFLVMRCLNTDRCGGASDRLHQIPMVIRLAAEGKRLLFIKWENRPAHLEDFFLPPPGGLDWRLPAWLDGKLKLEKVPYINNNNFYLGILANYSMNQGAVVDLMCNFGKSHGQQDYDKKLERGESNFETVYRDVWRSVFQPVPPIQALIEKEFTNLGLTVGNYTSVHVRSQFLSDNRFDNATNENAVNCGFELQPDLPVYIASDSSEVTKYLVNYGDRIQKRVVAREVNGTPLHLDRGANYLRNPLRLSEPVDQFYDTFVDLYLLAGAKCVTYGKGGYGKWASLLSQNPNCKKVYTDASCTTFRGESDTDSSQAVTSVSRDKNRMKVVRLPAPEVQSSGTMLTNAPLEIPVKNPWDDSSVLPIWMKEYFVWHREQRQLLDQSKNWEAYKFLIMRCLHGDRCGGTSDRLHKIPLVIRLAAEGKRLLFIKWEDRPARLEEFLLPPSGGLDWRVPAWLDDKLKFKKDAYINNENFYNGILERYVTNQETMVDVMATFGKPHGQQYYDKKLKRGEPNFEQVFRDVWMSVFQPVPPIQTLIDEAFTNLGLSVGNYTSVHVRSRFLSDNRFDNATHENAVNCSLKLQPDLPIFVASDSSEVTKYLLDYGRRLQKRVVAREGNGTLLHLDRGANFLYKPLRISEPADQFYDTFVDLYLLAGAKCITYGKGGYGKWASLLSKDPKCRIVHTETKC